MKPILVGGAVLCFTTLSAAQHSVAPTPAWAKPLLEQLKLTPETAQLDPSRWAGGGMHRLNTFQKLWDDWRFIDPTARSAATDLLKSPESYRHLLANALPFVDVKPMDVEKKESSSLAHAIGELHASLGKPLTDEQKKDLETKAKVIQPAVAQAAAILINSMPKALELRTKALAKFGGPNKHTAAYELARKLAANYHVEAETLRLLSDVDLALLMHGGQILAEAMDRAVAALAKAPMEKFEFAWETPAGIISLNGAQDNVYGVASYLLIIDSGGNDRYTAGAANRSANHPISLSIDLTGDDKYEATGGPAFGAGILGYGFLVDAGGNDSYKADILAQGMASFGVGMLLDRGGKDRYEIDRVGQGAAFAGVAVLSDLVGDDGYHCYMQAQGFGGVKGCGVLIDRAGNDVYDANDSNIKYPSPQDNKHNVSLAQGAAFGRRDHPGQGNSLAGGVGILVDAQGDDRYRCGVFGQGVSYWYGLGMLIDLDGNDTYGGVWYCQGSGAHYGVSALVDMKGDDKYFTLMTMGQGSGHDYSTAILHDAAGNDTYECPGNTMGFGIYNGIGILWDEAGDDVYKSPGAAFGATGETRPDHLCLGLFIDEGGRNEFPKEAKAKPKSTWVQPPIKDTPKSYGAGIAK